MYIRCAFVGLDNKHYILRIMKFVVSSNYRNGLKFEENVSKMDQ